ncbi:TPA: hypothetical protein DEP30_00985 [Candidatus Nomurabacteria bacterium]|nr:MAG: hypothetical protein UR97_C0002G0144 [Candidatus Nomurabacteria bacterium GW2011_GWE2_36_115]KKP94549.1 MAG: hypothetical protein US00_C0001G0143 [Candidatus Nomurabacteria bacterium GW2011_GWF2_36_126]KKP97012.1 MAG: hypothetical protein US04_C0001G0515 [Candidatus Nomurabacteria bacterium GW2011_GWD2_36_14]KKP99384.1 MAG: hypothetical protein US08_C0001G0066 [Candidatus Nomurabacteria bacterium GW2011_GWF2_36_19]KKQ05759.1 MAG: hypothetical protein US17_C0002G0143 [Candidatus Nomuraba
MKKRKSIQIIVIDFAIIGGLCQYGCYITTGSTFYWNLVGSILGYGLSIVIGIWFVLRKK